MDVSLVAGADMKPGQLLGVNAQGQAIGIDYDWLQAKHALWSVDSLDTAIALQQVRIERAFRGLGDLYESTNFLNRKKKYRKRQYRRILRAEQHLTNVCFELYKLYGRKCNRTNGDVPAIGETKAV